MRSYKPVFVGRKRVDGLELLGEDTIVVNEGGFTGNLQEALFLAGRPTQTFASRLERLNPSLLHAHFGSNAVNAIPLTRRLNLPLVVTFHGFDATQRTTLRNGLPAWRYGRRRPRLINSASCMLAVSDHIRESLIAVGVPEERIKTHYIGVDLSKFVPDPSRAREPIVLGVGRFVEKKGFQYLIDAMADVQKMLPEAELVLLGDGHLGDGLRAQASERLRSFQILGPCSPDTVKRWMQRARLLVAPSVTDASGNTEGLPLTVIEAMASGLPVVATNHAGIPEAVEDGVTGFLAPERDAPALAKRIIDVFSTNDEWEAQSRASRRVAERKFDLAAQTTVLESLYSEVE